MVKSSSLDLRLLQTTTNKVMHYCPLLTYALFLTIANMILSAGTTNLQGGTVSGDFIIEAGTILSGTGNIRGSHVIIGIVAAHSQNIVLVGNVEFYLSNQTILSYTNRTVSFTPGML